MQRSSDENRDKLYEVFPHPNCLLRPTFGLQEEDEEEEEGLPVRDTQGTATQQNDTALLPRARVAQHIIRTAPVPLETVEDSSMAGQGSTLEATLAVLPTSGYHSSEGALVTEEEDEDRNSLRNLPVVSPDPQESEFEGTGGMAYISQREADGDIVVEVNLLPLLN